MRIIEFIMKLKVKITLVFCFLLASGWMFFQLIHQNIWIHNQVDDQKEAIIKIHTEEEILQLPIEEYLIGVVASEMPVSFELEALKAQAVASRSFAIHRQYEVDDTTSSQVYKDEETLRNQWKEDYEQNYQKIRQAVLETQNEVLTFQGEVISASFFSSSNGKTNNSEDYWVSEVAYLVSVDSHWDMTENLNQIRSKTFNWQELEIIFGEGKNYEIIEWYENGYVKNVKFNQIIYTGRKIRELLQLSSSSFELVIDELGITFITSGSGHGVGMSQYGANGMAKEGYDYQAILKHYYQGVEIVKYE